MTTQKFSGDQLAKIAEFRTRAGELADYLEHLDGLPHDQGTWCHVRNDKGEICGTPACALGHAVAGGLVPGTVLTVLSNDYRLVDAGLDIDTLEAFTYAEDSESTEDVLYAVPLGSAGQAVSFVEGYPTRGNTWIPWEDLGLEYYGAVVREGIFYDAFSELDVVIARLREYAEKGYLEYPERNLIARHDAEAKGLPRITVSNDE